MVGTGEVGYSNLVIRPFMFQAIKHDYFSYFPDRYLLSITMIFGASVAGKEDELRVPGGWIKILL